MTIFNAKDRAVGTPYLPNLSEALSGLSQTMNIFKVKKTMEVTGEIFETLSAINFEGIIQPMKAFAISLKPEGQRSWRWYTMHSPIGLPLVLDDVLYYADTKYRVAEVLEFNQYGYFEYHLVQDFSTRKTAAPLANQAVLNKLIKDVVFSSPLYATISVTPQIPDATKSKWAVYNSAGKKIDLQGTVKILSAAQVLITVPAAGTYRIVGES